MLAKYLAEVVATESPVFWMEAVRRIAAVAGVSRIGDRIRDAFLSACKLGNRTNQFVFRDNFLWADETLRVTVRNRSSFSAAMKKLELVAREEICSAIEMAASTSFGLDRQDIPASACRLLGFSRTTDNFWTIIDPLCAQILSESQPSSSRRRCISGSRSQERTVFSFMAYSANRGSALLAPCCKSVLRGESVNKPHN